MKTCRTLLDDKQALCGAPIPDSDEICGDCCELLEAKCQELYIEKALAKARNN